MDQTYTPCIGRQSLNHWTSREVPTLGFRQANSLVLSPLACLGIFFSAHLLQWSLTAFGIPGGKGDHVLCPVPTLSLRSHSLVVRNVCWMEVQWSWHGKDALERIHRAHSWPLDSGSETKEGLGEKARSQRGIRKAHAWRALPAFLTPKLDLREKNVRNNQDWFPNCGKCFPSPVMGRVLQ